MTVLQVILTVHKAAYGAASIGVAILEAVPEVAQAKSIKYELELASAKAFPSMQLLEGKAPLRHHRDDLQQRRVSFL